MVYWGSRLPSSSLYPHQYLDLWKHIWMLYYCTWRITDLCLLVFLCDPNRSKSEFCEIIFIIYNITLPFPSPSMKFNWIQLSLVQNMHIKNEFMYWVCGQGREDRKRDHQPFFQYPVPAPSEDDSWVSKCLPRLGMVYGKPDGNSFPPLMPKSIRQIGLVSLWPSHEMTVTPTETSLSVSWAHTY